MSKIEDRLFRAAWMTLMTLGWIGCVLVTFLDASEGFHQASVMLFMIGLLLETRYRTQQALDRHNRLVAILLGKNKDD